MKPMPPNKDMPNRILLFMRSGMDRKPLWIASQVNVKMPVSLPITRAKNRVSVTPLTEDNPMPLKFMLALAKAKRGMTI